MMNIKDAAARAVAYFGDVYGSQFGNVMLEEVERDDKYWYITLGYDLPPSDNSILAAFQRAGGKAPRGFKVFKIDASTGEVVSMKIREVAAVE
jgi:hypothetical protein